MSRSTLPGEPRITVVSAALCLVIVAAAFLVRYAGIGSGFPELLYGDEYASTMPAKTMFETGDLYPRIGGNAWFVYGSFFMYLQLIGFAILSLAHSLLGLPGSVSSIETWQLYWVGRFLSAILGTLSVLLVFQLGRKAYGVRAGLIAAAFLAFAPLAVRYSQYTKPDTAMVFLILAALYFSLRIAEEGRRGAYILAGLCAGLAVATKFHAIGVIVALLVACMLRGLSERKSALSLAGDGRIYLSLLGVGAGFLGGMPFALLDFPSFLSLISLFLNPNTFFLDVLFERTADYSPIFLFNLLAETIGGRLTLNPTAAFSTYVGVAGVVYALVRHRKQDLIIISFLVATYRIILPGISTGWNHYWLPEIPLLVLLGARLMADAFSAVERVMPRLRPVANLALAVVTAFLVWAPASLTISQTSVYARGYTSAWTLARDWIVRNVPPGAQFVMESSELARLPQGMYRVYHILPYGVPDATARGQLAEYRAKGVNYALTYRGTTFAGQDGARLLAEYSDPVWDILFGSPRKQVFLWEISPWAGTFDGQYSTARVGQARAGAIGSASFEDPQSVWRDWFVEDGGSRLPDGEVASELTGGASTEGQRSLHLRANAAGGVSRVAAVQVIPWPYVDDLEDFRLDYRPIGGEMVGSENRINLIVDVQSAGGVSFRSFAYRLYDRGQWDDRKLVNFLRNPGFEDLDREGSRDAWQGIGALATLDQVDRFGGVRSLKLGKADGGGEQIVRQDVNDAKPNVLYRLDLRLKGGRGFAEVRFFDSTGKHLSGVERVYLPDSYSSWRRFAFEMVSPKDAVRAQVWLGAQKAGEMSFDDVEFGEVQRSPIVLDVSNNTRLDTWNTFQRDLKKDLVESGVNWSWVQFVILRLEVLGGSPGSGAGVYFDNIRAAVHPAPLTMRPLAEAAR